MLTSYFRYNTLNMSQKEKFRIDLAIVLAMVLVTIPLVVYFKANFLISTILFFGAPSLYLIIRKPKNIKKNLAAAFLFGIIFGFFLDFMAEINNAWSWPTSNGLVFSYKLFDLVPIDVMIWYFLWIFSIVVFYDHFIEKRDFDDEISRNYTRGLIPAIAVILGMIVIYLVDPEILKFDYAYLILGALTLPPFIYFTLQKPESLAKFLKISLYFTFLYLSFEVTALKLNQWSFPGQYVGNVSVLSVNFPFEEFLFWILVSSTIVLSYYKHWVDDDQK